MNQLTLRIQGRVQGVGFRQYIAREARRLALCGSVRNRRDGSVEIDAEGGRAGLDQLLRLAGSGPPGAVVTGVAVHWGEGVARFDAFHIRP